MTHEMATKFVYDFFNHMDASDWDNVAKYFHEDIKYERPGYAAIMPIFGKDAVMKFFKETRIVKSGVHTTNLVLSDSTHIICLGGFAGLSREGKPLTARYADYYKIQEGLIVHRVSYFM